MIKRLDAPFFFYDLDGLNEHLSEMKEICDQETKLWYACKANPLSAILKIVRNLGFGIDVASIGELDQVLSCGIKPAEILSTGPAKSKKYLKTLLEHEVSIIVLESLNQAYWLNDLSAEMNIRPKVLLRTQLSWKRGSSVLGGDEITPFGIPPEQWEKLNPNRVEHLDIQGIHIFQWGNILELSQIRSIWWSIAEQAKELAKQINIPLNILDLGGGLGIPYTAEQKPLDFKDVHDLLAELKTFFNIPTIWMELGRYVIGPYGHYAAKVIDRKEVRGRELLVLEGGINHISRPALTGQAFPCELFRQSSADKKAFYLHGPLCTAIDKLGLAYLPEDIKEGDWVVFSQAGAYGFTESMPYFLCHDTPAEVVLYRGDLMTPRVSKKSSSWLV
jgi:diaminopimelate decarboxylase